MRPLITSLNITVDGFVDHTAVVADAEHHDYVSELLTRAGSVMLGRATHDLFEARWPAVARDQASGAAENAFARTLESLERIVVSREAARVTRDKARVVTRFEDVERLKSEHGKAIVVLGSPGLVRELIGRGLVDECHFCVQPMLLKAGLAFARNGLDARVHLDAAGTNTLKSGVMIARYRPRLTS